MLCAQIFAHAGHNHLNNLALCGSLVRVHGLRVKVERDLAIGMPQKLLDGFYVFPVGLQRRAEGMAEGVPADVLVNAHCFRLWLDVSFP